MEGTFGLFIQSAYQRFTTLFFFGLGIPLLTHPLFMFIVGIDNFFHQPVPDHVGRVEVDGCHTLKVVQQIDRQTQT